MIFMIALGKALQFSRRLWIAKEVLAQGGPAPVIDSNLRIGMKKSF